MSVTQRKPEEQYEQNAGIQNAQQQTQQAQQQAEYKQSQSVQQAQQAMQQSQAAKPQGYASKYGTQLDSIMQQIQNNGKFKYDFNGDELFKYYADLYTQKGKQASMDAMGQAAALTGGYGNSYAQQVGNQAYDQYLQSLYDKGMELRDRAYQQYQDQQADRYNQYNMLANADERLYGRYRDAVSDWQDERNYLANRYDSESDRDYSRYTDPRNFAEQVRQADLDEAYRRDTLGENIRQSDLDEAYRRETFDWNKSENQRDYERAVLENDRNYNEQVRQADLDEAYRRDTLAENIRQSDLDEAYRRDTLAENIRQSDMDEAYRRDQMAEQIRQFNENLNWDKMSSEQKYAAQYALSILENGQMPSEELLRAAGLSAADAQKLLVQISTGSYVPAQQKTETETTYKPMGYDEASRYVLQNTPLNTPVSKLNGNTSDTRTLADLDAAAKKHAEDMAAKKIEAAKEVYGTNLPLGTVAESLRKNKKPVLIPTTKKND